MTTALAAQLAQIRSGTTNPLDLKAQKNAHSQSLLFNSQVAGSQDFDSLYQLCYEGFEELCLLDSRFLSFARTVFCEQSKHQDRTQMTVAQNEELDVVLEDFLCLVGGRLSLKPALKAVEWIIRRFRVHESNTLCLVLVFLPYHTTPIFTAILSLLPQKLPQQLKFLHPYVQSLANPPRHTFVYSASKSRSFLTAFSNFVLKSCGKGYQYSALVSFWASITTEAIATIVNQARSPRHEAQRQSQEEVLISVLPLLNEGLSIENAPDLRVGCYMILTVLASKVDLEDNVLTAMMEAVVFEWKAASHAGLICLAVLAQQRRQPRLPRKVLKAVLSLPNLEDDLSILSKQYQVDLLVLGIVVGVLNNLRKTGEIKRLPQARKLLEAGLMHNDTLIVAIGSVLSVINEEDAGFYRGPDVQGSLIDLVLRLADSSHIGSVVHCAVRNSELDLGKLKPRFQKMTQEAPADCPLLEDIVMRNSGKSQLTEDFDVMTRRIPTRTAYEISFLSHSESYVYDSLAQSFCSIHTSVANLERFSSLPVLRKTLAMSEPLFLSFFMRLWCSNGRTGPQAAAAAFRSVTGYLNATSLTCDMQILLPYVLYGLSDSSSQMRRAAADLVLTLSTAYSKSSSADGEQVNRTLLGQDQIYGQNEKSLGLSWLSAMGVTRVIEDLLVPNLEECILDDQAASQLLADSLNGIRSSRDPSKTHRELKTSLRASVFTFLCNHAVGSPIYSFKLRLLQMLNKVERVGSTSRTKLLLPLLSDVVSLGPVRLQDVCQKEHIEETKILRELLSIVTPGDREGIQKLRYILEERSLDSFKSLRAAAFRRIACLWPQMKADLHMSLAGMMLDAAVRRDAEGVDETEEVGAIETLQSLRLSTAVLQAFLSDLPTLSTYLQDKPSASKRRRTSHGQTDTTATANHQSFDQDIRKMTLVLELIESSKAEQHSALLKGLFQVISDLRSAQSHSSTAVGYLQILAMDSMLAIVTKAKTLPDMAIDASAVRADVLIDYIRTTTSPQVRNTALLLVASIADVAPQLVLHSVMPIFTFMGANVLRQEDDYSAHVVEQTMESVVPHLVRSLDNGSQAASAGLLELLLNFAAAFEHVPQRRRFDLFASLVGKVGPNDYLFALFAILLDKYPTNKKALQLSIQLCSHYDVTTQLKTMEKYLQVVMDAWKPKPTKSPNLLLLDHAHSPEFVTMNLLPLAIAVFKSDPLLLSTARIFRKQKDDASNVRASLSNILEQIFLLSQYCNSDGSLNALCLQVLNSSLELLPTNELVNALEGLLGRAGDDLRRQVIQSFEHHLNTQRPDERASREACLAFLPRLISTIQESKDTLLAQSAVSAMDQIIGKFGKTDIPQVIGTGRTISSNLCLGATDISLRATSLLCLATMIEVSGDLIVPIIPLIFPKVGDSLELSIGENTEDANLHNAGYSVLQALLLYLPWMITGADLDRMLTLSHESANAEMGSQCDWVRVETLQSISKQVNAKECFAALNRTWASAVIEGPKAVSEHLQILRLAIDWQPKSIVVRQSEELGGILIKAFSLRRLQLCPRTNDSYTDDEVEEVETAINETAIAMIYKLNDASFRPVFTRIMEWATSATKDSQGKIFRQITWYTFLSQFFDTLKSIVTSYAAFVIEHAVQVLQDSEPNNPDSMLLWRRVIQTLQKTFEHDQDEFYQVPSHFTPVSNAMLSQIPQAAQIPIIAEVIRAITELAVASDSATQHKEMNAAILKYMRSDVVSVRLAAVQCERALTDRLGEEWLALLPEMLPFISELQEDDDETVEKETLRWIQRIEEILGESLNPMLQ